MSVYHELVPPSIARLIVREGGVEEWLVEMQVSTGLSGTKCGREWDC